MTDHINKCLLALLGSQELVDKWWGTRNKAFDYHTPKEVWEVDKRKVAKYLADQLSY